MLAGAMWRRRDAADTVTALRAIVTMRAEGVNCPSSRHGARILLGREMCGVSPVDFIVNCGPKHRRAATGATAEFDGCMSTRTHHVYPLGAFQFKLNGLARLAP